MSSHRSIHRLTRAIAACVAGLLLPGAGPVLAQQTGGVVEGIVRSADSGSPLVGAQVIIEGPSLGALTGADGRYRIAPVPPGTYTVAVHFLGYATERREGVVVREGQTTRVEFDMRTEVLSLGEIVVTGVAEATSRTMLPFTVGRVGSDALQAPAGEPLAAMQGRVAGISMVTGSAPGSGSTILLRTPTSINRSNAPLIVVDDVILTESSVDLSTLDIESIEVVKGAAAASLYGSRAGSGVINIRTRRGSSLPTDRTRFTIRSEYGTSDLPRAIKWARYHNLRVNENGQYLDEDGNVVESRADAARTQFGFQDQPYPGPLYDHVDALFDPGDFMVNSVSIGHNGGNTNWIATVTRRRETGVVLGHDGYERNDFRINLDHRLQDQLNLSLSLFHSRSKRDELPGNVFFDFIHQAPDIDLLQPDPDGTPFAFQPDPQGIRANPLYQIAVQDETTERKRTLASATMRYFPLPWLAYDVNVSYDLSDRFYRYYLPKGKKSPDAPTGSTGEAARSSGATSGLNASMGMTVTRDYGPLRTRVMMRGLLERESFSSFDAEGQDLAVGGIGELDAVRLPVIESSSSSIRSSGYFLTADATYADKYILNALVRRDGSSLFGPDERWHTYYRASAAYRMGAEPWWPFESINELKLRYSRGTAGGRPNFADRFETFVLQSGGGLALGNLGNRALKPSKTTEQEFGVDIVALGRISLQLTYATQTTVDQLVPVPLPAVFGFGSQWQNAGTVKGHTYEGTLEARLIEREDFGWTMSLVADRSRNKIVEYDRPCHFNDSGLGYLCAGEVLGGLYGQKFITRHSELPAIHAGSHDAFQVNDDGLLVPVGVGNSWRDGVAKNLWGTTVVIDGVSYAWGMPIKVTNPDGTPAIVRIGDSNPDLRWGFSNNFRWRDFTLSVLVDGQIGGDVYNATKQRMYQYRRHADADQAGKPEERKKPDVYYSAGNGLYNGNVEVSWFVEDATYTKLREVALRYRLRGSRLGPLASFGLDQMSIALIGRNLFTWTNYSGYDPEIGSAIERIDDFDYPKYRTLTASIELEF